MLVSWNHGINIYKAVAEHQFRKVWTWQNPRTEAQIRCYDLNGDGYSEIIISGGSQTRIFEMEAVKAMRPQPGEVVGSGPYTITWQKYDPPRCDSFSLFYTTDDSRTYKQIAHGLPPDDTSYL